MIINTNMAALNTYNALHKNEEATSKSLARLSSGLRINSASDDAAGLAISQKMQGQIRGLNQAQRNSQDGISLLQTAEGALSTTQDILQRMRELATQSASDTNTTSDRNNIQTEMTALESEIDQIGNTTQFNTKNLLDGSMGSAVNANVKNIQTTNIAFASNSGGTLILSATATLKNLHLTTGASLGIASGNSIIVAYTVNGTSHSRTFTVTSSNTVLSIFSTNAAISLSAGKILATASVAGLAGAVEGITITVENSSGTVNTAASNALSSFAETTQAANKQSDGSATIQVGANTGQNMNIAISDMRSSTLGVYGLQVTTQSQANVAIKVIDNAIQKVSTQRAYIGAMQNRLTDVINNLTSASQNITAASSNITDVDMAQEMTKYQKNNVLQQAAQAMLAQANQQPQGVLQLLR